MTISNVDSTNLGIDAYRGTEGLSAEALMIYISTRLTDLDADIEAIMQEQTDSIAEKEALQKFRQTLLQCKAEPDRRHEFGAEYEAWKNSLPPGSPARLAAEKAQATYDPNATMSDEYWESNIAELDNMINTVSKDSELLMIRLQQLMSQRQTAVQLTTNMMSTYNETQKSIVGNIR